MKTKDDGTLRGFDTGATRDTAEGKLAYNSFYSPFVMKQFARFMNMNRLQSDGKLRDANNWQKGIPMDVYRESLSRHYQEFWVEVEKRDSMGDALNPRGSDVDLMAAACGMMFNIQGYVLEWLKRNAEVRFDDDEPTEEMRERQGRIKFQEDYKQFAKDYNVLGEASRICARMCARMCACGCGRDDGECDGMSTENTDETHQGEDILDEDGNITWQKKFS